MQPLKTPLSLHDYIKMIGTSHLTTMPLQDSHTSSDIAEWLQEVAARYEMIAIVHDHDVEANRSMGGHLCTDHTWQRLINTALKEPCL